MSPVLGKVHKSIVCSKIPDFGGKRRNKKEGKKSEFSPWALTRNVLQSEGFRNLLRSRKE